MKKTLLVTLTTMTGAASAAGILIDDLTNNGGFDSTESVSNKTSILGGWTATQGVWLDNGGSSLTTAPFGTDVTSVGTNNRFIQIHSDSGEDFRSAAVALVAGETIHFSVDLKNGGTAAVDLFDGVNSIALGTLENGTGSFVQQDFNGATVAVSGNYQLRIQNIGESDVHIDRVFLETTAVPEPSSTALLGLGGLALILRRRK